MNGTGRKGEREFTGRHMLMVMVAFFGVIIAVNLTMATLAGRTWTGLVVKNSFVASQNYNGELAEARRQSERGWVSELAYRGGHFDFSLKDREGQPVVIDDLKVWVGRPAFERQDQTVALAHVGDGRYRADIELGAGPWQIKVTGGTGEQAYRRESRIVVDEDQVRKAGN